MRIVSLVLLLLVPFRTAFAHSFAMPYTLPVPFSMYAYGATAALLLSFVIVGVFSRIATPVTYRPTVLQPSINHRASLGSNYWLAVLRIVSVLLLLLTVFTGLFGTKNAFKNFNMTFFWIVFILGFTYLTAIFGDLYRWINPWRVICEWIERRKPDAFRARAQYPQKLAYYPALVLYIAFIWLELFGHTTPMSLSVALMAYTLINLAGAWLFGIANWFRYGEFFAVFLRLTAMMAPVRLTAASSGAPNRIALTWRRPFVGLLEEEAEHMSLVVFILFMLCSTAYDGMRESAPWSRLFWGGIYPSIEPLVKAASAQPYALAAKVFGYWQWLALLLSPLLYLGVYLFFLKATKAVTSTSKSVRELALKFAFSLVPIAFVYHVTHYYTLLLSQGPQVFAQISDPFGVGWNLFGTARAEIEPILIDASIIWHTQVGLILLGHVVSVYLAHLEALKLFQNSYRAAISQLPMLLLMVALTTAGLWVLSLPMATG